MNLYDEKTHVRVELPAELESFNGDMWKVLRIERPSSPGKSGKVTAVGSPALGERTLYPQVFGCYIADAPRDTGANENGQP